MSGGSASYNIRTAEISRDLVKKGMKQDQVEAVMTRAGDDNTWNAIERFIAIVAEISGGQDSNRPEGVNPNDSAVKKIGQFAVEQHNKNARTKLDFIKVVGGVKWNVIPGTFYAIFIETRDAEDTNTNRSKALIVELVTGYRKLIWYKN